MNYIYRLFLVIITLLSINSFSHAQDNPFYFKGELISSTSFDLGDVTFTGPFNDEYIFDGSQTTSSIGAGLGFGKEFNDQVRADFTLGYRYEYDIDIMSTAPLTDVRLRSGFTSATAMANVYINVTDFNAGTLKISPYIGFGAGAAYNWTIDSLLDQNGLFPVILDSKEQIQFAWQIGAGLDIEVSKKVSIDLGYQYLDLGQFESAVTHDSFGGDLIEPLTGSINLHEASIGLRYKF